LVLSTTVTVNEDVTLFPAASVALYVMVVVVPTVKLEPLTGPLKRMILAPELASVTDGEVHVTLARQTPASFAWVILAGRFAIAGFVLSTMIVPVHWLAKLFH
jgi:hypothetical protein